MENWKPTIATPSRTAAGTGAPAASASPAVSTPFRSEGYGWTSRNRPARWARGDGRPGDGARGGASGVHELLEARYEEVDESLAAVRGLGADARDEGVEHDRGDDKVSLGVATERGRGPAA